METKRFTLHADESLFLPVWKDGDTCQIILETENERTSLVSFSSSAVPVAHVPLSFQQTGIVTLTAPRDVIIESHVSKNVPVCSSLSYHFVPSYGWINDPNGLILLNGVYHLFFQYNPVATTWANMSWGHATSKDLLTWTQQPTALLPEDEEHTIFSGSALKEGDSVTYVYTVANLTKPAHFVQKLATSEDGWHLNQKGTILDAGGESRDPKLFVYHHTTYLLLFLEGNTFALYKKGETWNDLTLCNTFSAPPLWECPDLYVFGDQLFFVAADGIVFPCTLEDDKLTIRGEGTKLYQTNLFYAGQKFENTDDTTVISWLRTKNDGFSSNGAMALPRRLSLENGVIIKRPPKGFEERFIQRQTFKGTSFVITTESDAFSLTISASSNFMLQWGDSVIVWFKKSGILSFGDKQALFPPETETFLFYVDAFIWEIQDERFRTLASFETTWKDIQEHELRFSSREESVVTYSLYQKED